MHTFRSQRTTSDHRVGLSLSYPLLEVHSHVVLRIQSHLNLPHYQRPTALADLGPPSFLVYHFYCVHQVPNPSGCIYLLYPSRSKPFRMYPSIVSILVQTPRDVSIASKSHGIYLFTLPISHLFLWSLECSPTWCRRHIPSTWDVKRTNKTVSVR